MTEKPRLHEVGEEISAAQHEAWARYWAQWAYVRPINAALAEAFGADFDTVNTGGGCICIVSTPLEGGYEITIGSGVDGPLWTNEHRDEYHAEHGRYDGFGLQVADIENGDILAAVTDLQASTPADVVAMVKRALEMARTDAGDDTTEHPSWQRVREVDGRFQNWRHEDGSFVVYPSWQRNADGTVTEERWPA